MFPSCVSFTFFATGNYQLQSDLAKMKAQYPAGFKLQGERFSAEEKKTHTSKIITGFCILLPIFMKSSLHSQG